MELYQNKSTSTATNSNNPADTSGNLASILNQLGGNSGNFDLSSIQQIMPLLMKLMNNQNLTGQENKQNNSNKNKQNSGVKDTDNSNQGEKDKKKITINNQKKKA